MVFIYLLKSACDQNFTFLKVSSIKKEHETRLIIKKVILINYLNDKEFIILYFKVIMK